MDIHRRVKRVAQADTGAPRSHPAGYVRAEIYETFHHERRRRARRESRASGGRATGYYHAKTTHRTQAASRRRRGRKQSCRPPAEADHDGDVRSTIAFSATLTDGGVRLHSGRLSARQIPPVRCPLYALEMRSSDSARTWTYH